MVLNPSIVDSTLYDVVHSGGATYEVLTPLEEGDNEVHFFEGVPPALLGFSTKDSTGAALVTDLVRIVNNLWRRSEGFIVRPGTQGAGTTETKAYWLVSPFPLKKDANWIIEALSSTASDYFLAMLHTVYGPTPLPPVMNGEQVVLLEYAATTAKKWTEIGVISDLDPDAVYYLLNAFGENADYVRFKADSFRGATPGYLGASATTDTYPQLIADNPPFAMAFSGAETLSCEVFSEADVAGRVFVKIGKIDPDRETFPQAGRVAPGLRGAIAARQGPQPMATRLPTPPRPGRPGFSLFG